MTFTYYTNNIHVVVEESFGKSKNHRASDPYVKRGIKSIKPNEDLYIYMYMYMHAYK